MNFVSVARHLLPPTTWRRWRRRARGITMESKAVLIGAIAGLLTISAATAHEHEHKMDGYANHVLVSNGGVPADFTDPNLINGWGLAFNPTAVVWVNDADAGKSTLYDGTGKPQSLVVTVPGPGG